MEVVSKAESLFFFFFFSCVKTWIDEAPQTGVHSLHINTAWTTAHGPLLGPLHMDHCLDHCTWTTAHGQLCLSIILQNNTWQNQGGGGGNRSNAEQGGESVSTGDSQRSFRVIYTEINVQCLPPVRNLSLSIGVHLSVLFLFLNLSLFLSDPFPADGPVSWFFSRYSSKSFC